MPNGTYGGVRGWIYFTLLDLRRKLHRNLRVTRVFLPNRKNIERWEKRWSERLTVEMYFVAIYPLTPVRYICFANSI